MLILNRNAGESFTIDGRIKIKILNKSGRIRLGIEAPKELKIVPDKLIEEQNCQCKQK